MKGEKLKRGDDRMRITVTTKEDDHAVVTIERLRDDIELNPSDMNFARKALKKGYKTYKRARMVELDARVAKKEKEEEVITEFISEEEKEEKVLRAADEFIAAENKDTTADGSMEVLESAVSVIKSGGDGYDE